MLINCIRKSGMATCHTAVILLSAADLVFAPTLAFTGIFPRTYI